MDQQQRRRLKVHDARYLKARALVHAVKKRDWAGLSADANIVGAAFGRRIAHGEITDDPAMVIYTMRKVPKNFIPPSRLLPRRVYVGGDCVEVDVVETGPLYPLSFTLRERPAPAGVSIGNANEMSAGTLGSVVTDNSDGSMCILSNNHVMARQNAAALGEIIVQPGLFDAGSSPADDIATLKRFVMINAAGNRVDGAIAQVIAAAAANVIDQVKNNLIPTATAGHPAIGLLFAGGCSRTIMNPIGDVLNQLNISFPGGAGSTDVADIGLNLEKVGRTTEYTTSTVTEIDATVTIPYDFGNATFDNQITTAWMSDNGDSGSLVYQGGAGGDESKCGCGTQSAAESLLGVDLKQERCMADVVRDKFLRQTRIGRWAIDVFFLNEERFLDRFNAAKIDANDRELARKMYDKYADEARQAFVQAEKSEQRVTDQHLRDAQNALKRAQKYMTKDEHEAAEKLLALATRVARGKNARELLSMLNDETLLDEIQKIAAGVKSLRTSQEPCE
jgi:hypothetical protein